MDLTALIKLGWNLQYVKRTARERYEVKDEKMIYDTLNWINENRKDIKINGELRKKINALLKRLDKYEIGQKITTEDSTYYIKQMDVLYNLFLREVSKIIIFEAVKECMLDKNCLVQLMNKKDSVFFDTDIWNRLSDIAKSDFSDSSKCLLMGAATPATMITLRAAEEVVRKYYEFKTKTSFTEKTWGILIKELRGHKNVNKDLLEHLDYVRKTRRNFAQHPDKIYNQREAERIFMEIVSTTHDIYNDMQV